eukprot:TRINITY_DN6167_c0_g1_i6.p1 TRINITY_DN6167_c0_g1~~TRINITY_DN6167_c0_g1_i6.p1  ORF type:complete len:220 (+),score=19.20 TRINITY_DN6167_c0_g1_i6:908-1567(+)
MGDFNLVPCSLFYRYLKDGHANFEEELTNQWSGQTMVKNVTINNDQKHYTLTTENTYQSNRSSVNVDKREIAKLIAALRQTEVNYNPSTNNFTIKIGEKITSQSDGQFYLSHKFGTSLKSIYAKVNEATVNEEINQIGKFVNPKKSTFESCFTHITQDMMATVDYIWTILDSYQPVRVLQLPGYKDMTNMKIIPNESYPSDHFSLVADLIRIKDATKNN